MSKKKEWLNVNVNQDVKVKLTPEGLACFRSNRIRDLHATPEMAQHRIRLDPEIDDKGYYTAPLWSIMSDFGSYMYHGGPNLFDTEIKLCTSL